MSRAYVIMPILNTLEQYALRVEQEMSPKANKEEKSPTSKVCPVCENQCALSDRECVSCGHQFPEKKEQFISCNQCKSLNPISSKTCHTCGANLHAEFTIKLRDAYRDGAIAIGVRLSEEDIKAGENLNPGLEKDILSSGQDALIAIWSRMPPEARGKFIKIINQNQYTKVESQYGTNKNQRTYRTYPHRFRSV